MSKTRIMSKPGSTSMSIISLLLLLLFLNQQNLVAAGSSVGADISGSVQIVAGEETGIPMPYIAARDEAEDDSSDAVTGEFEGVRSRVRYKPIIFSALLPGSGQIYQGQARGYMYIAAEVASLAGWVFFRNKGGDVEEEYIVYVRDHARTNSYPGETQNVNVRGDGEYYEHVARWNASGEFDLDKNYDLSDLSTINPWEDEQTWNGEQWRIAAIMFGEPDSLGDYVFKEQEDLNAALQYYIGRAYQPDFYWDWTMANTVGLANKNKYLDLRDESNLAFQRATISLIVLMANHAVSVIDAFVSARIELPGEGGESRTKLDVRMRRGSATLPGAIVRLTHKF